MDYDHARKAGNAADVWKHFCLLAVTARLLEPTKRFRYVDTHAGAGRFRLRYGGEWQEGIGRLTSKSSMLPESHYVTRATAEARVGGSYLGSWRWVLSLARSMGNPVGLCLFDTAPRVIAQIPDNIPGASIEIEQSDGYDGALRNASADLVLVDPPYAPVAERDWEKVIALSAKLSESGACFLVWYPLFRDSEPPVPAAVFQFPRFELEWSSLGRPCRTLRGCGLIASENAGRALSMVSTQLDLLASALGGRFVVQGEDR